MNEANNQNNGQPWSLSVAFHTNVKAAGVKRAEPPKGIYRVKVGVSQVGFSKDDKTKQPDPNRPYIFQPCVVIAACPSGAFKGDENAKGIEISVYATVPNNTQDAKAQEWSEAFLKKNLVALGHPEAAIMGLNGGVNLSGPAAFDGREGWLFYEPGGEGVRSSATWLTQAEYEKVLAGQLQLASSTGGKKGDNKNKEQAQGGGTVGGQGGVDFSAQLGGGAGGNAGGGLGGGTPPQPPVNGAGATGSVAGFLS